MTRHLYRAWNACLRVLRESGADAPVLGDNIYYWQKAWPGAYAALRKELERWDVETVYESLRERMRLELGIELDSDPHYFTPDELRARVETFAALLDRDE